MAERSRTRALPLAFERCAWRGAGPCRAAAGGITRNLGFLSKENSSRPARLRRFLRLLRRTGTRLNPIARNAHRVGIGSRGAA